LLDSSFLSAASYCFNCELSLSFDLKRYLLPSSDPRDEFDLGRARGGFDADEDLFCNLY